MLETLKIKNIAVIEAAEVQFKSGLNVLSGETGAGKSIVIEAISLLLGGRATAELIRAGCEEGSVEGLFDIRSIPWMKNRLERLGFSSGSKELLIKRLVHRGGRHRIHVNGELATLTLLQELCEGLIDLCGQNEHQSLTKAQTQVELLDRYGGLTDLAKGVSSGVSKFHDQRAELDRFLASEAEREKQADFLRFQIEELKKADLKLGEDIKLSEEKSLLQSASGRVQAAEGVRIVLEAEGEGTLDSLRTALNRLRGLVQLDERTAYLVDSLERALAETEEVNIALHRYLGSVEVDPERLEEVQDRLSLIADLRRKYGTTIEEILSAFSRLENELHSLQASDERIVVLRSEISNLRDDLLKQGKKLSQSRRKAADLLAASVTGELKDLRMEDAKFCVEIFNRERIEDWGSTGSDLVQYLVQPNRGEDAKPLGKIASGGELSRLMLAIRRVIADRGGIGVYLFDEIDAGIGGQTAFQVGKKLKSVAEYNQVICITHLPQVASFADHHLIVVKSTSGRRTITEVKELRGKTERKEELARMLAGPELTKKSLENAAELLELSR